MNPKPTGFNLDVENYLENQDDSQDHSWKRGTTLVVCHSIVSVFKECKLSKQKTIKIGIFSSSTIGGMKFFIILQLRKSTEKIVFHVGTNDVLMLLPKKCLMLSKV